MNQIMPAARRIQILVADEPADWTVRFMEDLHSDAVRIFLAAGEEQGLEVIRREHVDLAVIAGDNPRVGGLDLVRRMHWVSAELPVILVDGDLSLRLLQEALRIGVRTVLPRPVNIRRLIELSAKILNV